MPALNIIDATYFEGPLQVPQKSETAVTAKLQMYIDRLERKYLEEILGYELYKNFKAALEAGGVVAPKWTELKDGVEYEDRMGNLRKWKGFAFTEMTTKKSPIANYVYFHYLRDAATAFTASGEKNVSTQNAEAADGASRQCRVWNEMVDWNEDLWEFLYVNQDIYGEYFRNGFSMYSCSAHLYRKINPFNI